MIYIYSTWKFSALIKTPLFKNLKSVINNQNQFLKNKKNPEKEWEKSLESKIEKYCLMQMYSPLISVYFYLMKGYIFFWCCLPRRRWKLTTDLVMVCLRHNSNIYITLQLLKYWNVHARVLKRQIVNNSNLFIR